MSRFTASPASRTAGSSRSSPSVDATARCRDGDWSFSQHRQGTCSHHGGVGFWISAGRDCY
ncbi:DUF3761 domain-containing protein [Methylobacterium sp. J-001]|nr:DUF3761 domain-containing protein [Methylobacterium sp. J-001]